MNNISRREAGKKRGSYGMTGLNYKDEIYTRAEDKLDWKRRVNSKNKTT
jgi:hypothetical protein